MSGSTSAITAIVERMMEKLQKENPDVEYKRKVKEKKCPVKRKRTKSRRSSSSLH